MRGERPRRADVEERLGERRHERHHRRGGVDPGAAALQAVAALGYPLLALPSGAGHDAVYMARVAPAAMIFVRNPTGTDTDPGQTPATGVVFGGNTGGADTDQGLMAIMEFRTACRLFYNVMRA